MEVLQRRARRRQVRAVPAAARACRGGATRPQVRPGLLRLLAMDFDLDRRAAGDPGAGARVRGRRDRAARRRVGPRAPLPAGALREAGGARLDGRLRARRSTVAPAPTSSRYILVLEELSRADAGVGVTVAVHTSATTLPDPRLGHGRAEEPVRAAARQRRAIGAFALSEPDVGSDASSLAARLRPRRRRLGDLRREAVDHQRRVTPTRSCSSRAPIRTRPARRASPRSSLDADHVQVTREEEKLGLNSSVTGDLVLDGARGAARPHAARRGQGLRGGDVDARRRPDRHRGTGAGHRAGRVRGRADVRLRAPAVRQADRASSRPSSGSSRTWRRRSTPRACSPTGRPG